MYGRDTGLTVLSLVISPKGFIVRSRSFSLNERQHFKNWKSHWVPHLPDSQGPWCHTSAPDRWSQCLGYILEMYRQKKTEYGYNSCHLLSVWATPLLPSHIFCLNLKKITCQQACVEVTASPENWPVNPAELSRAGAITSANLPKFDGADFVGCWVSC